MKIQATETHLIGRWLSQAGRMAPDVTCQRIEALVSYHLTELGKDQTGWETLYLDPDDGRLWELTYPQSDSYGGGPPALRHLTVDEAKSKYGYVG
jgi:hypothetical protein